MVFKVSKVFICVRFYGFKGFKVFNVFKFCKILCFFKVSKFFLCKVLRFLRL